MDVDGGRASYAYAVETAIIMGILHRSKPRFKSEAMGVSKTAAATKGIEMEGGDSPMED